MKIKELNESQSTNVLVCDVQPGYKHHAKKISRKLCRFLNKQTGRIVIMYNGTESGQTDDTEYEVYEYLMKNGLSPKIAQSAEYVEKEYGFLRSWMDQNVPPRIIIKIIRAMVMNQLVDGRDLDNIDEILDDNDIATLDSLNFDWREESIYLPGFLDVALLKNLSPFYLVGGGRNECLKEIELICNAFNIKYKRIDSLIY